MSVPIIDAMGQTVKGGGSKLMKKGQALIESVVAVGVVALVMTAAML